MEQTMYVAIDKEDNRIISGMKGQAAFTNLGTLGRSVGQSVNHLARLKGVKSKDLYNVVALSVDDILKAGEIIER